MSDVRFTVLGPLTVTGTGGPVVVPRRRERAVLATLLAAGGEPVTVDRLLDEVWGSSADSAALNALHVAVSRLRSLLEPDRSARSASVLATSARGYALTLPAGAVDADRFGALVADAGRELAKGHPERAAQQVEQAEQLWGGPPYADVAGGDLVAAETTRLEELRLTGVELLAQARLGLGRPGQVVAALEPLLGQHPFRERLWQLAALALYRCDRQAEALAALRRLRELLADQLGVDPAPATRELESAILRQDPALADPQPPVGAAAVRPALEPGPAPLVGRDAEFAQLRGMLTEAATGARFALVEGEPGIGKTRLLEEVVAYATSAGARVVWARCSEGDLTPAYWPWIQVARALSPIRRGAPPPPPEAAALLDPRAGGGDLTDERRYALFDAISGLLAATAGTGPVVLLLEDLHWADPASAQVLAHLAVRLHDEPVAVVVSRREPELGGADVLAPAVAALTRRAGTRRVVLHGLAAVAAASLVTGVLQREVPAEVAAALHRRAEGNPFFLAELSRLLDTEQGLGGAGDVDRAGIPAGLRDVVRRRLDALPPATRAVLEAAAVVGRESDTAVVVAASGLTPDACLDALEPALRARLLVPVAGIPGRHRFAHALVQEVALGEVSSLRLARVHARVADALLVTGDDDDAETAAGHLWAAGGVVDPARAAPALEQAAARALRRTAYESADDLLDRALTLWRGARSRDTATDEAELMTTLRLARLRRARRGYGHTAASVPLDRADDLARRTGRLDLLIGLLHMRWGALTTACDVPAAVAGASEMRELADTSADPLVQLVGWTAWGVQCWQLGRVAAAADTMAQVLDRLDGLGPVDRARLAEHGQSLVAPWALFVLELAGRLEDGEDRFERLAAGFPDPYARVVVSQFSALIGFCTGDPARAARWAARGLADDRGRSFSFLGAACQVSAGWASAVGGQPDNGLVQLEQGLARFRATGARTTMGLMAAMRVDARLAAGHPAEQVRAGLEADAAEVAASGELACLPALELAQARVAEALGEDPGPLLHRAAETAARMGLPDPVGDISAAVQDAPAAARTR